MALSVTSPIAILNFTELLITVIVTGLISNLGCLIGTTGKLHELQFIDAIVFGYLIVTVVVTLAIVTGSELHKTLRLVISGGGAVLWLAAGALMLHAADSGFCIMGEYYDRAIAGGILSLANTIAFGIDAFFVFRHSD